MTIDATGAPFMQQAIGVARQGLAHGELPIGWALAAQGRVIASGSTQELADGHFLVSADLLALEVSNRVCTFPRSAQRCDPRFVATCSGSNRFAAESVCRDASRGPAERLDAGVDYQHTN